MKKYEGCGSHISTEELYIVRGNKRYRAIIKPCLFCNNDFICIKYKNKKFCNNICYREHINNKVNRCKNCNKKIYQKSTYCKSCYVPKKTFETKTIQECIYTSGQDSNRYTKIRDSAKRKYRSEIKNSRCENCGFNRHIQVCHIKSISSFSVDTLINVVNDISNLVGLCPNCHKDLDHGYLDIKNIDRFK